MLDPKIVEQIKQQINEHAILLYMKGTPDFPMCGFSAKVVNILREHEIEFHAINVLDNPAIRQALPIIAQWPTFPQLWAHGELIGGCDIVTELEQQDTLEESLSKKDEP